MNLILQIIIGEKNLEGPEIGHLVIHLVVVGILQEVRRAKRAVKNTNIPEVLIDILGTEGSLGTDLHRDIAIAGEVKSILKEDPDQILTDHLILVTETDPILKIVKPVHLTLKAKEAGHLQ